MTRRLKPCQIGLAPIFLWGVFAFMLSPLIAVLGLSFFRDPILTFPPSGYTLHWYVAAIRNEAFSSGLIVSLQVAVAATLIGVPLGLAASIGVTRLGFPGAPVVSTLLLSPLVIPGIVAGLALYLFYLDAESRLNIDLIGTYPGLVAAHTCLVIPWVMRLVSARLIGLDTAAEDAARGLGASKLTAFLKVGLPSLRPALVAAACFGFIASFENLEMSLALVGPGRTTLPIAIMQYLQFQLDPTIAAVSSIQILMLGGAMLVANRFAGLTEVL